MLSRASPRRSSLLRRGCPHAAPAAMAEDTAAYTLKAGPKAELDGLRAAREEFGPIPPRPGTRPLRVGPARTPPHLALTCSPCDAAEMKVTREEMKNARLPLECAQLPLMRTTHASPHATE